MSVSPIARGRGLGALHAVVEGHHDASGSDVVDHGASRPTSSHQSFASYHSIDSPASRTRCSIDRPASASIAIGDDEHVDVVVGAR